MYFVYIFLWAYSQEFSYYYLYNFFYLELTSCTIKNNLVIKSFALLGIKESNIFDSRFPYLFLIEK